MKYHMNKQENQIVDPGELNDVISRGKYITLALCRENEPYAVTMNYGFDKESQSLYFHTSETGLKNDIILQNPRVCGTIVEDRGYQMGKCDHSYRSVVFWGTMQVLENMEEKKHGMNILLHHLEEEPGKIKERLLQDDAIYEQRKMAILRLDIDLDTLTGKEGE